MNTNQKISQMNVLLTGATGGIGRVIAKQLVEGGASVLLTSHSEHELESLATELQEFATSPTQIQICQANLLKPQGIDEVVSAVNKSPITINTLINNAGIMQFSLFEEQNPLHISRIIELNSIAPMLLIQRLIPQLKAQPQSQVLNIGSTFGSIGYPGFVAYSTSKAAMQGFSEALKRELQDTTVQIKYLSPRATKTELNPAAVVAMNKALGNSMDSPEVVAIAALKILSNQQSQMILGWPEKLFVKINKLFPAIVDKAISGQLKTIKKFASQQ